MSANTEDIAPQPGLYSEYAVNIADGLRSAFTALDMPGYIVRIHKRRHTSARKVRASAWTETGDGGTVQRQGRRVKLHGTVLVDVEVVFKDPQQKGNVVKAIDLALGGPDLAETVDGDFQLLTSSKDGANEGDDADTSGSEDESFPASSALREVSKSDEEWELIERR